MMDDGMQASHCPLLALALALLPTSESIYICDM
jgi:hypothetical protein